MHVCLQRPFTMTPVFCLMLNRICLRQKGNKIWSRACASLCSGPYILRNEANKGTNHPSQRSQWCHQGKAQCQLYQGVQSPSSSHRHTLTVMWEDYILHTRYHSNSASQKKKKLWCKCTSGEGEHTGNAWTFCFKVPLLKNLRLYRHMSLVYNDATTHLHLSSSPPYAANLAGSWS